MSAPAKLTVATSYPIHPARGGGQRRVAGLYRAVAALGVEVDVVTLGEVHDRPRTLELAPGLRELRVPKSDEHEEAEQALHRRSAVPVTDIALAAYHSLTPAYAETLARSAADASAVVASHPFAEPAISLACPDLPLIYEAHNVETELKAQMLGDADPESVEAVRACEAACCARASLVLTCSGDDGRRLGELFGLEAERTLLVPNGCDCDAVRFVEPERRDAARQALGIEAPLALFVGSWHEPNIAAARCVVRAAEELRDVRFLLVGGAGLALREDPLPANVDITGPVHERFLGQTLGIATAALNPMLSGSGTNLKMLDYAAAGVPVISSRVGARGIGFVPGDHYVAAEPDQLAGAIDGLLAEPPADTERRVRLAHEQVRANFDWPGIAERWLESPAMERISLVPCP